VSFDVVTATSGEDDLIKEFVSLSGSRNLKTWIAIGGFDFSNEEAATHTTW
jgi:chitinase